MDYRWNNQINCRSPLRRRPLPCLQRLPTRKHRELRKESETAPREVQRSLHQWARPLLGVYQWRKRCWVFPKWDWVISDFDFFDFIFLRHTCCYSLSNKGKIPKDSLKFYRAADNKGKTNGGFASFVVSENDFYVEYHTDSGKTEFTTEHFPARNHTKLAMTRALDKMEMEMMWDDFFNF